MLTTQGHAGRTEEEAGNDLAAKLTPQEKKKTKHKSSIKDALCQLKTEWRLF